jgi:hypothetical protein
VLIDSLVTISGSVEFSPGVETVMVNARNVTTLTDMDNGIYNYSVSIDLEEGANEIVVKASSGGPLYLTSTKIIQVTIDEFPSDITILSPLDGTSFNGANVHVKVWTESMDDIVTVNGVPTTQDGYIRYAWIRLTSLDENTIEAKSVDFKNRESFDAVDVDCSDLTYTNPGDSDNDGVSDLTDPEPNNPSVSSSIRINTPVNGKPIIAR